MQLLAGTVGVFTRGKRHEAKALRKEKKRNDRIADPSARSTLTSTTRTQLGTSLI